MAVMITKFINGEEVLGETSIGNDEYFEIENPVVFYKVDAQNSGDKSTIAISPYSPFNNSKNKTIQFKKSQVLCQYEPMESMVEKYNSIFFNSSIVLPKLNVTQ